MRNCTHEYYLRRMDLTSNATLKLFFYSGIPDRRYVSNADKASHLGNRLERISDRHVRASLGLQQAFGLRREESIKFQPSYADRTGHILLKGSWTKGGSPPCHTHDT